MTDADNDSRSLPHRPDEDPLARLVRAAGRRPSPSAAEYERVRRAAHRAWQMQVHGRRRRSAWLALAASLAVMATIVVATGPWPPPAVAKLTVTRGSIERLVDGRWEALSSGVQILPGTTVRASSGGGAAVAMASGIVVRAREATEWTFDDATRIVLRDGTLYVDTGPAQDALRDLEIVTPQGTLRHIGTQYEVRALSSRQLRVRVREGRVRFEGLAAESTHEAPAGEELLLTTDGAFERQPFPTDSPEWQWAEALATPLELDGSSAFDALQWVAREIGKRLSFEDANAELLARRAIIHGDSAGLEPLQVLEIIMATSPNLDYSIGDGTLVIRRR